MIDHISSRGPGVRDRTSGLGPSARMLTLATLCLGLVFAAGQSAMAIPPSGPNLQLSPRAGEAGTWAVASGALTYAGPQAKQWSEPVDLYFSGSLVATGATNDRGSFSIGFTIPRAHGGPHYVVAIGRSSRGMSWGIFTIPQGITGPQPPSIRLNLTPDRGSPGTRVEVRGRGLACARVNLYFEDSQGTRTDLGQVHVAGGSLQTLITVPATAAVGPATLSALSPNPALCSGAGKYLVTEAV
jgi:hypothetical protein